MIKKIYRLKEREVKRVLSKGKPFFSYQIVLNKIENNLSFSRFAIIMGSKSVNNNVTRNFFRRNFYYIISDFIKKYEKNIFYDYVFVVKKKAKFDKKDISSLDKFKKDIDFLLKKELILYKKVQNKILN